MLLCMFCHLLGSLDLTTFLELEGMKFSLMRPGFMVMVQKSKNDQLRRGDEVTIPELSSFACPVKLLKRYLYPHSIFLKTLGI